eukprot:gb/GECG01006910.1/.p1 GENE.gb/GECG01006910.1/~~gb/GECG01006910.1/.p1  ORF type:complete len:564 (+),score=83.47 gb/GECG01006910.1/:1-1692(+)
MASSGEGAAAACAAAGEAATSGMDQTLQEEEEERASWGDWNSEVSEEVIPGVFSGDSKSLAEIWDQCKADSGFDWHAYRENHEVNEYDFIRLVNFLRQNAPSCQTREDREKLVAQIQPSASFWKDDQFLTPVIPGDPLIQRFQEEIDSEQEEEEDEQGTEMTMSEHMKALLSKNEPDVNSLTSGNSVDPGQFQTEAIDDTSTDSNYFGSYGNTDIHAEMLWDKTRTLSYKKAIDRLGPVLHDKTVLDVGSGTGILAMFCAKAGAKHVYAIEATEVAEDARQSVAANNMTDRITIIKSKAETVNLPVEGVDVIVSEWMGYGLLFENMLPTILYCRDRWLNAGGYILPDVCGVYLEGITDSKLYHDKISCWQNVYGFQMPTMEQKAVREAHVMEVDPSSVSTERQLAFAFDVRTVKDLDLDVSRRIELNCESVDILHGLVLSFDCCFSNNVIDAYARETITELTTLTNIHAVLQSAARGTSLEEDTGEGPNILSTACQTPVTHWKQTALFFPQPLDTSKQRSLSGTLIMHRSPANHRSYYIRLFLPGTNAEAHTYAQNVYSWVLE